MAATHTHRHRFWHRHSLSIVTAGFLVLWIYLYGHSSPRTHAGSFFGNAIADWSGTVIMVFATKYLYEKGSAESRQLPKDVARNQVLELLREHSLSIFLLVTGLGWLWVYMRVDAESKWGQVVGNLLSEWTQIFMLVVLTKRLIEWHSKESNR
jgi:hypothetical protein